MDIEHYNKTTNLIFQWMHHPATATPKALYRMLIDAGLLLTDADVAEIRKAAYQAGSDNMARRIAKRLWAEADAATDENKRALLNETALIADNLDAYAKAYPIGLGCDYETPKQGLPDYETLKQSAAIVESNLRNMGSQGLNKPNPKCERECTEHPAHLWDGTVVPQGKAGGVPCNCLGLSHSNDCPNWELPH